MVIISNRMTFPSNWLLPFNFSGVNRTLRFSARKQPIRALVYPNSTIPFQIGLIKSGSRCSLNLFPLARSNISVDSIRNPQNISTCMTPATGSSSTFFCPSQTLAVSFIRAPHESNLLSLAPSNTRRVAF